MHISVKLAAVVCSTIRWCVANVCRPNRSSAQPGESKSMRLCMTWFEFSRLACCHFPIWLLTLCMTHSTNMSCGATLTQCRKVVMSVLDSAWQGHVCYLARAALHSVFCHQALLFGIGESFRHIA